MNKLEQAIRKRYFAEDAATGATSTDITSVLNTLGSVVTYLFGQLGSLVSIIMQNT